MTASIGTELSDLVRTSEGLVSARIFSDPDIYELETERLFPRCWLFVAHESEIPQPDDFVVRSMGADPVIVSRDQDGQAHVLLNVCRHRGRQVCTEDAGRTARFQCGYHGWTYNSAGKVTGVPFADAYQGLVDKSQLGLCEAAVDMYHGLLFACWEPRESLREYLGDASWALDVFFGRTDAVEVVGPPVRWTIDANWKFGSANFSGDGTHIFTTHGFSTQLGCTASSHAAARLYRSDTPSPSVGATALHFPHSRKARWRRPTAPCRSASGLNWRST